MADIMVDLAREHVDKAMEGSGVKQAEVFALDHVFTTIRFASSLILESKEDRVQGVVLRVLLDGGRLGSAITTDFTKDKNLNLVEQAVACAKVKSQGLYSSFPNPSDSKFPLIDKDLVDPDLWDLDIDKLMSQVKSQIDTAMDINKRIGSVSGSHNAYREHYAVVNSNGIEIAVKGTKLSNACTVELTAPSCDEPVSGYDFYDGRNISSFNPVKVATKSAEMALKSQNPVKLDPGAYTVIFKPYCLTEILSYCFSYAVSAKNIQDKLSYFVDKLGEEVAADHFTLRDDPWLENGMFSTPYDDEGVATSPLPLIDKGILKNIHYDSIRSSKDSCQSNGHGFRRSDFRHELAVPSIFPSNYVLDSGERTADLIGETENGILVSRAWYVYPVNPLLGDFTGCGRSGMHLIKNGEVGAPLKQFRFFDNMISFLKNVESLGKDDVQVSPWFGYSILSPSIKVNNVRIPE